MAKKWISHQAAGPETGWVREMDCHPSPPGIDAHGRAWFVEEFEAHLLAGAHVFDTEEEARAAIGVEWMPRGGVVWSTDKHGRIVPGSVRPLPLGEREAASPDGAINE